MRQAAQDAQRLLIRRGHRLVAQHPPQRLDLRRRPIRQIGQRALLDLVAVAIAFAQQDRGWRIAIGNALDVHGELESSRIRKVKNKITFTWVQLYHANGLSDSASITYAKNAGQLRSRNSTTVSPAWAMMPRSVPRL